VLDALASPPDTKTERKKKRKPRNKRKGKKEKGKKEKRKKKKRLLDALASPPDAGQHALRQVTCQVGLVAHPCFSCVRLLIFF